MSEADRPAAPEPAAPEAPDLHAGISLTRATAVMSVGTTLSRATGFVRLSVMAWAIGGVESKVPDTYNLANNLPNVVYQLILGEILATVFVPVFVEYLTTRDRDESWRLASTILNLAVVAAAALVVVTVLAAPWLIRMYTFRAPEPLRSQQNEIGAFLLRLLMPQMIFYAAGAVLTGLLTAHRRFAPPMFAPVLNNVIVAATFVAFRIKNPEGILQLTDLTTADKLLLGGGTTLGVVVMTLILWPYIRQLPGRYSFRAWEWRHPAVRRVGHLAKYSLAFVAINQVGLWMVFALANRVNGGVTAFLGAYALYQLPYGIFAVSVFTALIPALSAHHVRGDRTSFIRDLSTGTRMTSFVVLPAAAGFVALATPIVRLLLEHGVFSRGSTELLADTLAFMALGLGGFAVFQQQTRALYARQDTRTPWLINFWSTAFNIVVNFPLFAALGVPGLALGHAASYLLAAVIGGAILRRKLGGIDGRRVAVSHAKILGASAATGAVAWAASRAVADAVDTTALSGQMLEVAAGVASGIAVYAGLAVLLRMEESRPLVRTVLARFVRGSRV